MKPCVVFFVWLALTAGAAEPLKVPFIAQKPGYCGPAALAMLAGYYGQTNSQDQIAESIFLPDIHGTLTTDLAAYAQRFHLWVRQYQGAQSDLRTKLSAGVPMLVLGKFGAQDHYFVVLGFDDFDKTVVVHSDQRADWTMPQEQFWRAWDRADRWTLLVCPPSRATWHLTAEEHNDLGVFLEKTGKWAASAGHYQLAFEQSPRNSYYAMNLGNVLVKQKLLPEAVGAFQAAQKVDPENADVLNNLADVYGQMDANLDEGVALCRRAIQLWPSHRAYYLDTLGTILMRQGKRDEAVAALEEAKRASTEHQSGLRTAIDEHLEQARKRP